MKNHRSLRAKIYSLRGLILCGLLWVGLPAKGQPGEQIRFSTRQDTSDIMRQIEGARLLMINNPDTAITMLSHALLLSRDLNFGKGERNALLNLTQLYYNLRQYNESILMSEALKRASDSSANKDALANAYYYSGLSYQGQDLFPQAFEAYTQALYHLGDSSLEAIVMYNNLGELLRVNNKHDEALKYFNQALHLRNRIGGTHESMINIYTNAARIYTSKKNFILSEAYLDSAETLAVHYHQSKNLFFITLAQANLFNKQGQPEKALERIKVAREIEADSEDDFRNSHLPDLYAGIAYTDNSNYNLAKKHYLRALKLVDSSLLNDRMLISYQLSKLYSYTKEFEKAYNFLVASLILLEQIKNKDVQSKLNEAEVRYQTAEKDKEITLKNMQLLESQQHLARKNFWMVSIAAAAVIFALVLLLIFLNYRRKRKIDAQEKEIDQLKAMMNGEEKERVRLSRELHDGVGSMLAAIKMNAGSVKSAYQQGMPVGPGLDTIITMLQETSSEVRTTAHNLMPDVLTRYDLQEAVIQYIQKVNSSHDIRIDFHVPEPLRDLNKPAELLLYRMIQELIQNVLKHAKATHIEVQLLQLKEEINLMVEDNGKGMDTGSADSGFKIAAADNEITEPDGGNDAPPSDAGFGLDNLKYRVHALHGQLIVNSRPGKGTAVSISFDRENLRKITT